MKYLDLTFSDPERNLACDEALIESCEGGENSEILRIWEPQKYFVVLGYSNRISAEVNLSFCRGVGIPILRRCSGGGAVLQGPGCLNFSLIVRHRQKTSFSEVRSSYNFVLRRHQEALEPILSAKVETEGVSDLTIGGKKFSGNAQHRTRSFVLLHGTFLLNLDISLVNKCLFMPSRQPTYRQNRSHESFLTNLNISPEALRTAVTRVWNSTKQLGAVPHQRIEKLVAKRYSREEWNLKF